MTELSNLKTLVLNDDFTPLNIVPWKKGMKLIFEGPCEYCDERGFNYVNGSKTQCNYCNGTGTLPPANIIEYYDYTIRDSAGRAHIVPAVISCSHHIHRTYRKVPYSRLNVFRRDNYICQYCGERFIGSELTVDHVIPRSMWNGGGTPTCWTNIVTCCLKCNSKKGNKTPEQAGMYLQKSVNGTIIKYKRPKQPSYHEIQMGLTTRHIPDEWIIYVEPFISKVN